MLSSKHHLNKFTIKSDCVKRYSKLRTNMHWNINLAISFLFKCKISNSITWKLPEEFETGFLKNKIGIKTRESNLEVKVEVSWHGFPGNTYFTSDILSPNCSQKCPQSNCVAKKTNNNKNITIRVHSWNSQSERKSIEEADFMMFCEWQKIHFPNIDTAVSSENFG